MDWFWYVLIFAPLLLTTVIPWIKRKGAFDYEDEQECKTLGECSIQELRDECAELNITGYMEMTQDEMIGAIYFEDLKNSTIENVREKLEKFGLETKGLTKQELLELYQRFDGDKTVYQDYTLRFLKDECKERGIGIHDNLNREEVIKLLIGNDKESNLKEIKTASFKEIQERCKISGLEIDGLDREELLELFGRYLNDDEHYEEYSLEHLKVQCDLREIKYAKNTTKADIIALIIEKDEKDFNEFLANATLKELKDYCAEKEIEDYEKLDKEGALKLIKEWAEKTSNEEDEPKNQSGEIPTIKLSDIAGLDEAKKALEERVILPLTHKEIYDKYDKSVGGGILLFGLPGTGKTMFAQAVATEMKAKFFSVKCSDIQSKWYGEAEKNVKNLFFEAKKHKRSVIFFDEFDALGSRRKEDNNGVNTVQEILAQMQGVGKINNLLLVIAATNCPWTLDGALLRPGRFSEKIYIPLPDKEARIFILSKELKTCKLDGNINIGSVAERLNGCNGADIVEFCEKIKMLLIRKEITKDKNLLITQNDISEIISTTKSSVQQRDIDSMNKFLQQK